MSLNSVVADDTSWVRGRFQDLVHEVERLIHGKTDVIQNAVICLLAEGHLLIEDVPGVAKTSLAKALAKAVGGKMRRIQFTPDLLPSDVVGVQIWDAKLGAFKFQHGPVFANIVLADEINRASPKTQSALLEAMAERQVTVDGDRHVLKSPHFVIATQNPIDHHGTYALPEAQMDRFMMMLKIGYPSKEHERTIVADAITRMSSADIHEVMGEDVLLRMMNVTRGVFVSPGVLDYIVSITDATRYDEAIRLGASPRASNALALAGQARAAVEGRDFVTADDVKKLVRPVLAHRLLVRPEVAAQRKQSAKQVVDDLLSNLLASIRVPTDPASG
jgi:MoxR-like ATPase